MAEFNGGTLPHIPDNLTIPQFFLDSTHSTRPNAKADVPWLIEDISGKQSICAELVERTRGLANALSTRWSIGENDVVCIFSPNHIDYPVAIWAAHRVGAVVTPANPSYTEEELVHQLRTTRAGLILVHPTFLDTALSAARSSGISTDRIAILHDRQDVKAAYRHPTIDDLVALGLETKSNFIERKLYLGEAKKKLAFLSFSSGTTGKPKAVAIPHYAVIANVVQMAVHHKINEDYTSWDQKRFRPGDVAIGVLPFFHIYGLVVNMHFMLYCGMSLVVVPKFNFADFLKSIVRHRVTHLLLVPPQIVLLCKQPIVKKYDLSHVRFCMSGAAPLSAELTKQVMNVLPNAGIGQGYGLTESSTSITMVPSYQKNGTIGSAGQIMPGVLARVIKPDGSLARMGEQGELVVKSPALALGYLNNEKATKETFVNGFLRTGDEVIMNEEGEIFVVDRLKEILKVKGFQVAPAELEGHLLDHPDVHDVCVVGVADEYSGELPLAYVVLSEAAAGRVAEDPKQARVIKAALAKHVADAKVSYKRLAGGVEFIDAIPKNPSGKILRRILRDQARDARAKQVKAKL